MREPDDRDPDATRPLPVPPRASGPAPGRAPPPTNPGGRPLPPPSLPRYGPRVVAPPAPPLFTRRAGPAPAPVPDRPDARLLGACLATLLLAAPAGLLLSGGEWAAAAGAVGIVGVALGALGAVTTLAGAGLGRLARPAVRLGLLIALALGVVGGLGLLLEWPAHLAQAHALEHAQDWSGALREYAAAGEAPPAAADPARVYVEWGEARATRHDAAGATDRLRTALAVYPGATAEARRALRDLLRTEAAWLQAPVPPLTYALVVADLDASYSPAICDAPCRASAAGLRARAHEQYGAALARLGEQEQAIYQFQAATAALPSSPYARAAHGAAATAYYALGRSLLGGPQCARAIPDFLALAGAYADTREGAQARAALAAPVEVDGAISGYPYDQATMFLSQSIAPLSDQAATFSDDYSAPLDAAGHYDFAAVPPGDYNLSLVEPSGNRVWWRYTAPYRPYTVTIDPLCPAHLAALSFTP